MNKELYQQCANTAVEIVEKNINYGMSTREVTDYLYNEAICKKEREEYHDLKLINFNDEIESIEELDERELLDIQVSGDNLFYANNILTKNSIGLPQTADFMFAATTDEVLEDNNQQLFHLLKTRWGNKSSVKPKLVNIDFNKMRYSDIGTGMSNHDKTVKNVQDSVGKNKMNSKKNLEGINWD